MRPAPASRYWTRSNELRVAGPYWLSRGGSVYTSDASEGSAEILTSRIGQEGPDSINHNKYHTTQQQKYVSVHSHG